MDGIFCLTGRAFNEDNQFVAFVDEGPAFEEEEVDDGPPSPGDAPSPGQGGAGAEPIAGELKEVRSGNENRLGVCQNDALLPW